LNIQGNEDRILFEESASPFTTVLFVRDVLPAKYLQWLRSLATSAVLDIFLPVMELPTRMRPICFENPSAQGSSLKSSQQITALLGPIPQCFILCAHSHLPRTVLLPDGRLIINPGSVGLSAYQDDLPFLIKWKQAALMPATRFSQEMQSPIR